MLDVISLFPGIHFKESCRVASRREVLRLIRRVDVLDTAAILPSSFNVVLRLVYGKRGTES